MSDRHKVDASFIPREGKKRRISTTYGTCDLFSPNETVDTPDESKSWRKGTLTAASLEASFSIVSLIVRVTSLANELGFGFDNWMLWFVLKSPTYMHHGIASRIALSSKILVFDAALTPAMRTPPGANPRNVETCTSRRARSAACNFACFVASLHSRDTGSGGQIITHQHLPAKDTLAAVFQCPGRRS